MNESPVPTPAPDRRAPAVRLAWPSEAPAIAALQRTSWAESGRAEALDALSEDEVVDAWTRAIVAPPMGHFRVLVAHDGSGELTGFAAIGPSDDPDADALDGEIAELVIDPASRGQGHGSRLLGAAVDTLRSDGYRRAVWWLGATEDRLRAFAVGAGWAPDGAHRELGVETPEAGSSEPGDMPGHDLPEVTQLRLTQIRLHTDISAS